jgi:hypothetical protein
MKRKRTHRTITAFMKDVLKCFCSYIELEGFHLKLTRHQDLTQYTTPAYLSVFTLHTSVSVCTYFFTDIS